MNKPNAAAGASLSLASRLLAMFTLDTLLQLAGAISGLGGTWLISNQDPRGFYLWIVSNIALVWLQLRTRHLVLVGMYVVYLAMSIHGLSRWGG